MIIVLGKKDQRPLMGMWFVDIQFFNSLWQNFTIILWKRAFTCISAQSIYYTLQKINATRIWSIIFLLSRICIHQVRHVWYPWKAFLFAFRFMPDLVWLFHRSVCKVNKLGAMSKRKSCKIDVMFCAFLLWAYARVPTAHSLYRNPPKQNIMMNFK